MSDESPGGPSMSNHGRGGSGPVKWCTSNFGGPLGPVKVESTDSGRDPTPLRAAGGKKIGRALRARLENAAELNID